MQVTQASLPPVLQRKLTAQEPADPKTPGFIIGVDPIVARNPTLEGALAHLRPASGGTATPVMVVSPNETPKIFQYSAELDLLKTVAGEVLKQVHPNLKTGVDAIWFVYRASKLYDEWSRPGSDKVLCAFGLFGLGMSGLKLTGAFYPEVRIPDHWANGINFVAKSGESLYLGKTPPINELILSTDKRMAIPLKLMKVAGLALDPSPQFDALKVSPLIAAKQPAPSPRV